MKIESNFFKIWFPKNSKQISIVPGKEPYPNSDADVTSCNYALLDYVGDKDAVYETAKLLSRRYPKADILLEPSDKKANCKTSIAIWLLSEDQVATNTSIQMECKKPLMEMI